MLAGVIPFGLVAGAAPAAAGYDVFTAVGMSTVVFAGASQLAMTDVLASGGSALVAAMAAWTINLRLLLYSASMAPHLAHEPLRKRLVAAFLTVDQNYALAMAHWTGSSRRADSWYLIGGGLLLGSSWIVCTAVGALAGNALPEDIPLDFAIPLIFLVLLIPVVTDRPAVAAALVGGGVAVGSAELGAGPWAVMFGALAGIAAGTVVDLLTGGSDGAASIPGADPDPEPGPSSDLVGDSDA